MSVRFAFNSREKRQIQTDTKSFDGSLKTALQKAINHISDFLNARFSDVEKAVRLAQDGLRAARQWLDDRLYDLRRVEQIFKEKLAEMDKAKTALQRAKIPFQKAIERLTSAQRAVDNLCRIRRCSNICIPGVKCRICWARAWLVSIPYPCCSFTWCMIRIPDPICVTRNVFCRVIRAAAYLALQVAKHLIRAPMLALDVARVAVTVAQIALRESKVVHILTEGIALAADIAHAYAHKMLENELQKFQLLQGIFNKVVTPITRAIAEGLTNLVNVRSCGFDFTFKWAHSSVFALSCEIKFLFLEWQNVEMKINFKNHLQSLWSAARSIVKTFLNIHNRKKRDAAFYGAVAAHKYIRKIRSTESQSNITFNGTNHGSNDNETDDLEDRVSLFAAKCAIVLHHMQFLDATIVTLFNISEQSKQAIDTINDLNSQIGGYHVVVDNNVTLEDVGVDVDYGANYNLTRDDMQNVMENSVNETANDPTIIQINSTINSYKEVNAQESNSIESHAYADSWLLALENITQNHFNDSDCVSFRDCVLFSLGDLYDIYSEETHANISEIKRVLLEIEEGIFGIVTNESFNIIGIYNETREIKDNLLAFDDLNIYCSEAPVIESHPQNVSTITGGSATFFCGVRSTTDLTISWLQSDIEIPFENSETLIVQNVSSEETMPYRCRAGNVVANITSEEAYIHVNKQSGNIN